MNVALLYGRGQVSVMIPDHANLRVIRKPDMPTLSDPVAGVIDALQNPVVPNGKSPTSFSELVQNAKSACIAICDITRPVPNGLFLQPLIKSLVDTGVPLSGITVLVATGLHRSNIGEELIELVGDPWVLENVAVVNHDARCDQEHVDIGRTATRGTLAKIDRRFVEADLRIATGLVEPHFMAGYSGGRKVIAPGLAHADTITTFHNHKFMANPYARNCNLDQNPLHEEQLEIVRLLGGALAINTVIDEDRNLAMINFGEIIESHAQAVAFVQPYCRVPLERRFDTVITSAAGYPLDKTYYQTIKGMVGAVDVLKPGGNLIVLSECAEGIGSLEFIEAQRVLVESGVDSFLHSISGKPNASIDEWQTQMQTKAMLAGQVHLYSSLSDTQMKHTGVQRVDDVDALLRRLVDQNPNHEIAVIPEGPYVVPFQEPIPS